VAGKDGDVYPFGRTYVLKAGPKVTKAFSTCLSNTVGTDEQAIEARLQETIELCSRDVQESAPPKEFVDQEDQEDEEVFPIPEEEPVQSWKPPTSESIARSMNFMAERVAWEARPRPTWSSPAWEGCKWRKDFANLPLRFQGTYDGRCMHTR
jgi:hypothetical protein